MMYFTTMFMSDDWGNVTEEDYFKAKDRVADDMIRVFERETGCKIRDAIEEICVASPTTYARYCGHPEGVIYGYETAEWDSLMPRMMMMKEEAFDEVISANLKGAFLCMKAAARTMMKQRYGRIVSLSSVVGLRGNAGQTNYAASKAGIIGLTKSIAKELASRGVTANAVAPGFIDTDMTAAMSEAAKAATLASIPLGKLGKPEDVAAAVAFLASEEAGYITGQVLAVDGGMAM